MLFKTFPARHSEPQRLFNCRDIGDMSEKGIHERAIWNSKYKEG
jgi:hypothetical protein